MLAPNVFAIAVFISDIIHTDSCKKLRFFKTASPDVITRIDCDVMANLKRPLLGLGHWIRVIQDAGGVWTVIKRLSRLVQNEVLGAPYWDQVCYCVCVCVCT